MNADSLQRLEKAQRYRETTRGAVPVAYEWGLQNENGAWFRLLREPHHTDQDIDAARAFLRSERDVVSLRVERLA